MFKQIRVHPRFPFSALPLPVPGLPGAEEEVGLEFGIGGASGVGGAIQLLQSLRRAGTGRVGPRAGSSPLGRVRSWNGTVGVADSGAWLGPERTNCEAGGVVTVHSWRASVTLTYSKSFCKQ